MNRQSKKVLIKRLLLVTRKFVQQVVAQITYANPGRFRIEIGAAKSGGISDPRNSTMLKMFTLIDIGERAGSGIPNIFAVCKNQGWNEPIFIENTEPDRVILELYLQKIGDK